MSGAEREDLGPLLGGHHRLSAQQIHDSRRERLIAAMSERVALRGYRATTITELAKAASVSTRDFYLVFETREECFLAAFDAVHDYLGERISAAAAGEHDWPHQVIAALRTGLEFFASNPDLAALCLGESPSASPAIADRFREAILSCVPPLALGRAELQRPNRLLPDAEISILGGAVSLASRLVQAGETEELPDLLPDLSYFILRPYLGAERAAALAGDSRRG